LFIVGIGSQRVPPCKLNPTAFPPKLVG
jgi:hypothetical protein